jgi:glycosyltransferase involved in cell wall biosynthesis
MQVISVVVPAFNEEDVIARFHSRLDDVRRSSRYSWEVVYVNDGSHDGTLTELMKLAESFSYVSVVNLSRNFGKEIAMTAGLDHAVGDAVIVIDSDLQDPPELIPHLIDEWERGYDVVYAQRRHREGETLLKRITATAFYRVIGALSEVRIPRDTGDFRLLSRRAVEALSKVRERHRFMKGLFSWVGFSQKAVPYDRDPRYAGATKWNYWKLWNFALTGLTSFTSVPLKLASYLGLLTSLFGFAYAAIVVFKTLAFGEPVQGYPSLMVVVLCIGGMQLIGIGVIGEYIARISDEAKGRPLYIVEAFKPSTSARTREQVWTTMSGAA